MVDDDMPDIRIPGRYMLEAASDKRKVLIYCHISKDIPADGMAQAQKVLDQAAAELREIVGEYLEQSS